MPFDKPDATGRSSWDRSGKSAARPRAKPTPKKRKGRVRKFQTPPELLPEPPFVAHEYKLKKSKAWQKRSIHCARLIEFLELEHLRHGGKDNGKLKAPHQQLVLWGIGAGYIRPAVDEAEALGLIRTVRVEKTATLFRLTYLPAFGQPATHDYLPQKKRTSE